MIKNDSQNKDNQVLELMYKVLKDRLKLNDNFSDREDAVNRFEEITKKLDSLETNDFNDEIETLLYTTKTLEEEKIRLEKLVSLLKSRVEERNKEQDDFYIMTGRDIKLEPVKESENLDKYQNRLRNINDYLSNNIKISVTHTDILNLKNELARANILRKSNEEKNVSQEQELKDEFYSAISDLEIEKDGKVLNINDYLLDLIIPSDIDDELDEISLKIREKQNEYDTYKLSLNTLRSVGQLESENELLEGLHLIGESLYYNKEQEYILNMYRLISKKEVEFSKIYEKREQLYNILDSRNSLRKKLDINNVDIFVSFVNVLKSQSRNIDEQKDNIDLIDRIKEKLNYKEEKLSKLQSDNEKDEILSLLNEFCLIDTADVNYEETLKNVSEEVDNSNLSDVISYMDVKDNQIVSVLDNKLNFDSVYNRAKNVMSGVVKVMNISKKEIRKEDNSINVNAGKNISDETKLINQPEVNKLPEDKVIKLEPMVNDKTNNIDEESKLPNNFELKVDPLANAKPSLDAVLPGLENIELNTINSKVDNNDFLELKMPDFNNNPDDMFEINDEDLVFPEFNNDFSLNNTNGSDSSIVFPELNSLSSDDNDYIKALKF